MARRSEHSQQEIKEMVLKAAEAIVIENGFNALKVRKIALDIGYTVGSVYMVFDNMADLIMQLKARALDDITNHIQQDIKNKNANQTIMQLAKNYLSFATENYHRWNMIFEHRLAENEQVPDWYQKKIETIFSLVELQFSQLPGSAHSKKQVKLAARALWSGIHGICILSLSGKMELLGTDNTENAIVLLVDNFLKGWIADTP